MVPEKSVTKVKILEGREEVVLEEQLSENSSVSSDDKTKQHHSKIQDDLEQRLSQESTAHLERDEEERGVKKRKVVCKKKIRLLR